MGLFQRRARLRAILVGGMLAAALVLPAAASADTTGDTTIYPAASIGATIEVNPLVHVVSKVVATVDVSFVCDPFEFIDWNGEAVTSQDGRLEFGAVSLIQASGRSIASSSAQFSGEAVLCDGATIHTVSVPVVAAMLPWKHGVAVVGARVSISDSTFQDSDYASTGPVSVKLTK